ncbi:MAG TPA: hypothetical protein VD864_18790, partial [Nocardioides sp.]|nr:hypothetical protein [Nocardioides sp.]
AVHRTIAALASSITLALGAVVAPASPAHAAAAPEEPAIQVLDYDLGDAAFTVRGFHALTPRGMPAKRLAPLELTGRAYVPADASGTELPMVVIAHGLFWSCADEATGEITGDWPCRAPLSGIRSDRGYDHLGRMLAERGILAVSVGANGVNAGELGEVADRARAVVVFRHLRMWRSLVTDGSGPLAGALTDAQTGDPVAPDLVGAVDLRDVGLLGHSRGGRGVMWAAADAHRAMVPDGVRLRAVFGMAAAEPPFMDHATRRLTVTEVPVMTWMGSCDATGRDEYNRLARRGGNRVNLSVMVHGANHNNLNSRWAASSGLPGGEDDASHPKHRPGKCFTDDGSLDDTLGSADEQEVAATYVEAFFARYLQGDRGFDDVLSGDRLPVRQLAQVDVRRYWPGKG